LSNQSSSDTDEWDPAEDPQACSKCGVHIGLRSGDYCDGCARELGLKPPMERCMGCGQRGPQERMKAVDISPPDEYYPTIRYLCGSCSGGSDE
jgi:hypothetical protein